MVLVKKIKKLGEYSNKETDCIETVAIKVLKETASRETEEDFMREVEIMSSFKHKHILSLLGVVVRGNYIVKD